MAEPITAALVLAAAPTLEGLGKLINALKAPLGKKRIDELRSELLIGLENVKQVFDGHAVEIKQLEAQVQHLHSANSNLQLRVEFLELPFWKRWFTEKPKPSPEVTP